MDMALLPTTLVGSYPQPDWLIDREKLGARMPPRVRAAELWRVRPEYLTQAQDDATVLAVMDQERAGIDIVSDGEMRRESYFNLFATALEGIDLDKPGVIMSRSGHPVDVPRVVGKVTRRHPVQVRDVEFLRASTKRKIKITLPGPFTMTQLAKNDFYPSDAEMAMDYAKVVHDEMKDLFDAGADVVQIDEPYMQAYPDKAREYGLQALSAALEGQKGTTAVHICFGYGALVKGRPAEGYAFLEELSGTPVKQISIEAAQPNLDCKVLANIPGKTIILGTLDLGTNEVETPAVVAERIRKALKYIAPERVVIAPDCGMKYLPREVAFGKLKAMVAGATIVREELAQRALASFRANG
jgi:5-methyltetrahydropteroyltriglutamate--homocysteine methyltransferase